MTNPMPQHNSSSRATTGSPDVEANLVPESERLVLPWIMILGRDLNYEETIHGKFREGEKILYIGAGLSTFPIEGRARGLEIVAVDKIFNLSPDQIEAQFRETLERWRRDPQAGVLKEDGEVKGHVAREQRERVKDRSSVLDIISRFESNANEFISDFTERKGSTYVYSELPALSNLSGRYDKIVISNLLNAYSDEDGPQERGVHFTHIQTLQSYLRLLDFLAPTGEISVFPHTTGRHKQAPYVAALYQEMAERKFTVEEQPIGKIEFIYPTPEHWRKVLKIRSSAR